MIKAVLDNLTKVQRFNLLSTENDNLTNALQEAAGNSRVETLRYLLDSVDHIMSVHLIKHKTYFNYTTIHRASFSATGIYNANVLEILLNHYPEAKSLLFEQAQDGSTALHESVYYQEISSVEIILSRLPTVAEKECIMKLKANGGYTVLHTAARYANADIIDMLLEPLHIELRHTLISDTTNDGHTPMMGLARGHNKRRNIHILQFYESQDIATRNYDRINSGSSRAEATTSKVLEGKKYWYRLGIQIKIIIVI